MMEEILPADALEKTLTEESEAKVLQIRQGAEAEARQFSEAFDAETEVLVSALRAGVEARVARIRDDLDRSLPLGRRRLKGAFLERELRRALDSVVGEIDDPTWQTILEARLGPALPILGPGVQVSTHRSDSGDQGLTATSVDGRTVFRVSVRSLTEELLETRREELVRALFPGRFIDAGSR